MEQSSSTANTLGCITHAVTAVAVIQYNMNIITKGDPYWCLFFIFATVLSVSKCNCPRKKHRYKLMMGSCLFIDFLTHDIFNL